MREICWQSRYHCQSKWSSFTQVRGRRHGSRPTVWKSLIYAAKLNPVIKVFYSMKFCLKGLHVHHPTAFTSTSWRLHRSGTFTAPVTAAATLQNTSAANGRQKWCAALCKVCCLLLDEGMPLMRSSPLSSLTTEETCCWKHCHKSYCSCWGMRADVMLSWIFTAT